MNGRDELRAMPFINTNVDVGGIREADDGMRVPRHSLEGKPALRRAFFRLSQNGGWTRLARTAQQYCYRNSGVGPGSWKVRCGQIRYPGVGGKRVLIYDQMHFSPKPATAMQPLWIANEHKKSVR
jgi:hypothetical protein